MKCLRQIFKIEMLIYWSTADLNGKVLFHFHPDQEIGKILVVDKFGNKDSTFHCGS